VALKDDGELAPTAIKALASLRGQDVDADIVARLPQSSGKTRLILIDVVERRRIEAAIPALLLCAEDADSKVRGAAVAAIGSLGGGKQVPDLVKMLQKTKDADERAGIERALTATAARGGAACVQALAPLAKSEDSALRVIALHALSVAGGAEALGSVKAALDDKDEGVQDEAVRTLSSWPNKWPEDAGVVEALLTLAKSGKKPPHRILALRGYLQYLQGNKKLGAEERFAKFNDVAPLVTRPDEKRLASSVLAASGDGRALEVLASFADDPAAAEEACSALVSLAERKDLKDVSTEQRRKALETVIAKAKAGATKKKAQELLKAVR